MNETTIAILGLGEVGAEFATDLIAAGATVRGYDPQVEAPDGVVPCVDEADAVDGAALVLSVNNAAAAVAAFRAASGHVAADAVWADLNSAAPAIQRELEGLASTRGIIFADVSIMASVPGHGVRTPMLASGAGADEFARQLGRYGGAVTVIDGPAGAAAERKLLRSVFYKGMSAAIVEALTAARAVGLEEWLRDNIAHELADADMQTLDRIVIGTHLHAARRAEEMDAAAAMLADLGVEHRMADAAAVVLHRLSATSDASD